jgi:serine/threonine protein kinase
MLDFHCKYCENDIQADYSLIGEFVECPFCGEVVVVPDPLLPFGSEYNGYVVGRLMASTLLWNTYQVVPINVESHGFDQALLRIPGTFFLKRLSDFEKFCEVVLKSGSLGIKGIAPLLDHSVVPGNTFFVFEFFPSMDLSVFIGRTGVLNIVNALRVIRRCAVALRDAWRETGIIHQNILPHNIRINEQREIRLMNIGLSQLLLEDENLLEQGFNIWDQRYISPEFALRGHADSPSCDIYALGMVLYFLLTGNHPYSLVAEENIPSSPIPDLKADVPDIPDDIIALFQLMVAKRTALRFSDWGEVLERIDLMLKKSRKRTGLHEFGRSYTQVKARTDRRRPVGLAPIVSVLTEKFKRKKMKKTNQLMNENIARQVNCNKQTRHIQSALKNMRRKLG